jgi:GT2 family glycosyltransferase
VQLPPAIPTQRPPIVAIIPTWNGLRHLPACLDLLRPQLAAGDAIIVVDNGSRDGTGAWLRERAPDVNVLALPANCGFAGGTNAGLRAALADGGPCWLLLLNDDAFVEPGCVAALAEALCQNPQAGAAAGALVFNHRPALVASAGIRVARDGVARDLYALRPVDELPALPLEIFGASGGLALLRRELLDDVGLFEEGFWSYLEDADLAWRARLRGWPSVLAPGARARHVYSATGGQGSPLKQRLLARNRLRVLVRCLPAPLLRACLPAAALYDALALVHAARARQPAIAAGRLMALGELPALLGQRRAIQARRTAPLARLAAWLERAPGPLAVLHEGRALDAVLRER